VVFLALRWGRGAKGVSRPSKNLAVWKDVHLQIYFQFYAFAKHIYVQQVWNNINLDKVGGNIKHIIIRDWVPLAESGYRYFWNGFLSMHGAAKGTKLKVANILGRASNNSTVLCISFLAV
jgi:hypothetical protein